MDKTFDFADWNPARGTVPAYFVDTDGLITVGELIIGDDGQPINNLGEPLVNDDAIQSLTGWAHKECASFENGRVLVPLKGSRA